MRGWGSLNGFHRLDVSVWTLSRSSPWRSGVCPEQSRFLDIPLGGKKKV